jgi:hypothetical protein
MISNDSKRVITYFTNINCVKHTKHSKETKHILKQFYQDITTTPKTQFTTKTQKHSILFPKLFTKPDILPKFVEAIQNDTTFHLMYTFKIHEKNVTLHFFLTESEVDQKRYNTYVKQICIWLNIISKYSSSKHCSQTLVIYIYLVNIKRQLPEEMQTPLGRENVNGGFTYPCQSNNELVVFRKEEWFKVFIHETFHNFGLDFSHIEHSQVKQRIASIFPIESTFDVYEAYTETWAEIINVVFKSFYSTDNISEYLQMCELLLNFESFFSVFQMVKILKHYNMSYNDLFNQNNGWKETTNVFAYYVVRTIFMNDYQLFLSWCNSTNETLIQSLNNEQFLIKFCDFIKKESQSPKLYKSIHHAKVVFKNTMEISNEYEDIIFLLRTLRMTVCG